MILENIINGFFTIIDWILSLLPSIPASGILTGNHLIEFTDLVFANLGLLDLVVPITLIGSILTMMLTCTIIKFGYTLLMWVLHKIPFIGIK